MDGCGARAPRDGVAPDSTAVAGLAGLFRLLTVNTAPGYDGYVGRGGLRLAPTDTLERYYVTDLLSGAPRRRAAGERPLAGAYEAPDHAYRDTAEVEWGGEGGRLYVGCRRCLDGSPTGYRIDWVSPGGFGGRWENAQSGIGVAVDRRGRRLPNPSGHYCATRVSGGELR